MKKLNILKIIIDFLWIISWPIIIIILFIIPYIFISEDFTSIPIKINGDIIAPNNMTSKIILSIMSVSILLVLYCLNLFKKTLRFFTQRKMFDNMVLKNLNTIGKLLIVFSITNIICSFIYNLNSNKINIEISISPLILILCLGLFFMVLSEIFELAKNAKEENDLTV